MLTGGVKKNVSGFGSPDESEIFEGPLICPITSPQRPPKPHGGGPRIRRWFCVLSDVEDPVSEVQDRRLRD